MPLGMFRKTRWDLKLNGTRQLLIYADDVDLLEEYIRYHKEKQAISDTSKEGGPEVSICSCLVTRMKGKIIT
jgi:hypothetical protein